MNKSTMKIFLTLFLTCSSVSAITFNDGFYKRTLSLTDPESSKFIDVADYPGGASSVIECADFTLAQQYESDSDPYINAFILDKENDLCQAGTIPYNGLRDIPSYDALLDLESGVYVLQGCYLGDMPYTVPDTENWLELYYRGPFSGLQRFDPGPTSITPIQPNAGKVQGIEFIYKGMFGFKSDTVNHYYDFTPAFDTVDFSVMFWYHGNYKAQTGERELMFLQSPGSTSLVFNMYDTQPGIYFYRGSPNVESFLHSGVPTASDRWVHLGLTYQNTGSVLTFYKDGVETLSGSPNPNLFPTTGNSNFGLGSFGTHKLCHCHLAEVEFYSRKLSAEEIVEAYERFPKAGPCANP